MYSTKAKQVFIRLYEAATEKLASVYLEVPPTAPDSGQKGQSNEKATQR